MHHRRTPEENPLYPRVAAAVHRQQRPSYKWPAIISLAAAVAIAALAAAVVLILDNPTAAADKAPVVSFTQKPVEYAPPVADSMGDGTWLVGKEIKRGLYASNGGASCYWERVSDLTGSDAALIDNGYARSGPQKVALGPDDFAFTTSGCGWWELVR